MKNAIEKFIEREAEKYGIAVAKNINERLPQSIVTGDFPKFNGKPDFITSSAFTFGAKSLAPLLLEAVEALDKIGFTQDISGEDASGSGPCRIAIADSRNRRILEAQAALASIKEKLK